MANCKAYYSLAPMADGATGAAGDPCTPNPEGAATFGCTADKAQELTCDSATKKLVVYGTCRGPKGCALENGAVGCDTTVARIGEGCRADNRHACSEDGHTELQCSPQMTWAMQKECTYGGCRIKEAALYCD